MYKLSLKQNMKIFIQGKWREYGETWESEERIDSPFVNCIEQKKKMKEEKVTKKPEKSSEEENKMEDE